MTLQRIRTIASWVLAPLLVASAVTAQAGAASAAATGQNGHHKILYVSRHAWPGGADRSCRSARFRTIQSAVNAARPGADQPCLRATPPHMAALRAPSTSESCRQCCTGTTPGSTRSSPAKKSATSAWLR